MKHTLGSLVLAGAHGFLAAEPRELTNSIGMKLVRIEPGRFTMGQDGPAGDYDVKKHASQFDDEKTWSHKRLITPGGKPRTVNGTDRGQFTLSETRVEPQGYLAATQMRDGNVQLISSKNHYVFNLAWLKMLPPAP